MPGSAKHGPTIRHPLSFSSARFGRFLWRGHLLGGDSKRDGRWHRLLFKLSVDLSSRRIGCGLWIPQPTPIRTAVQSYQTDKKNCFSFPDPLNGIKLEYAK